MFNKIFKTVRRIEREGEYYPEETKPYQDYVRCNVFAITAYVYRQSIKDGEQEDIYKILQDYLYKIPPLEFTSILIECVEKKYIEEWRLDTYDITESGKVYQVPDLSGALKDLWIDFMLKNGVMNADYYISLDLEATTVFSGGLIDLEHNYLLNEIDKLPNTETNKQALSDLVKAFIQKRADWEDSDLIARSLSTKIVRDFETGTRDSFRERSFAFKIFEQLGKIQYVKTANEKYYNFGVNQVTDKQYFIEDTGYYMPNDHFGSDIAVAADQYIVDKLTEDATKIEDTKEFLDTIRNASKKKWVIVLRNMSSPYIYQHFDKELKPTFGRADMYFRNIDQLLPIQVVYDRTDNKGLYAISQNDLGKLSVKQYDQQFMQVKVTAFSQNKSLLRQMLTNPPEWLARETDAERFLLKKVRLLINFTFSYKRYRKDGKVYFVSLDKDRY